MLIPGHYKKYSHFKGRDTAPTTSSMQRGELYRRFVNFGNTALLCSSNPGPAGSGVRRTRAILSRDRTVWRMTKKFCTALPIHLRVVSPSRAVVRTIPSRGLPWSCLLTCSRVLMISSGKVTAETDNICCILQDLGEGLDHVTWQTYRTSLGDSGGRDGQQILQHERVSLS